MVPDGVWIWDPILKKYKRILLNGEIVGYEPAIVLASGKDGELVLSDEFKEILHSRNFVVIQRNA